MASVSHCLTRLRFVLNDTEKSPNKSRIKRSLSW
ncbi:PTS transporter subunit EIIB [Vibrio lentus]|nr:PTS transporter subunit EIIB [Vibrio lentus]